MATRIVRFEPSLLPAVRRFSERVWRRPTSEAFYRWRYLDAPLLHGWLALNGDEVVATLWAFRRPWRVGQRTVQFLELFDWWALPELRRTGVGVRTLQSAMDGDDPCVLVGGGEASMALVPRLGFRCVAHAERFGLPLRGARLAPRLARRARLPELLARPISTTLVRAWFRPRTRPIPGGRAVVGACLGDEALRLLEQATAWPTRPLWPPEHLRWLASGFAGNGLLVPIYFAEGDALRGFVLLRVHVAAPAGCEAQLLELAACEPDARLHAWMVSEAAALSAGLGAGMLAALTTCPLTAHALRANRFLALGPAPVHVYARGDLELPGPLHLGHNTGDDPLIPAVETWW